LCPPFDAGIGLTRELGAAAAAAAEEEEEGGMLVGFEGAVKEIVLK
jgi:hypothetical protein